MNPRTYYNGLLRRIRQALRQGKLDKAASLAGYAERYARRRLRQEVHLAFTDEGEVVQTVK